MDGAILDMTALEADMADFVQRTSARKFSLIVTDGRNPDWYRNHIGRQNTKPPTIEQFFNIAGAMDKDPLTYIKGGSFTRPAKLPNEAILTQAIGVLLSSVGIDPYEDERARKIARQLPGVLEDVQRLISEIGLREERPVEETAILPDANARPN